MDQISETSETNEKKNNLKFIYQNEITPVPQIKLNYLREQVKLLRAMPQPEQRSEAWYKMREGRITASDVGTILGYCDYADRDSVLLKKVDTNAKFMKSAAMEHGIKHERNAIQIYERRNNKPLIDFGLLPHETISILACSPDSISEDGEMVEIKCPSSRQITGIPPKYYWAQCQIQLECCGLDRCDFLECSIKEIDEEDYMTSNFDGDFTLYNNGNEKGLVAEFFHLDDKSFTYEHSPLCLYGEELENWKNEIQKKYENNPKYYFSSYSHWYLDCVSCIPIYRNQEWFNSILPELENFWQDVIKYRREGLEVLKADIKANKEKKKQEKEAEKLRIKEEKELNQIETKPKKGNSMFSSKKTQDRDIQQYLYNVEKKPKKEYKRKDVYEEKLDDLPNTNKPLFSSNVNVDIDISNNNITDIGNLDLNLKLDSDIKVEEEQNIVEDKKKRTVKKKEKDSICLFSMK